MNVTIGRRADRSGLKHRRAARVGDGFVPLPWRAPSFKSYRASAFEEGHIMAVSIFDDHGTAIPAAERARDGTG